MKTNPPKRRWSRDGHAYRYGDWTIHRTEGEDRASGYAWYLHHPDSGEYFAGTLAEAKATACRVAMPRKAVEG